MGASATSAVDRVDGDAATAPDRLESLLRGRELGACAHSGSGGTEKKHGTRSGASDGANQRNLPITRWGVPGVAGVASCTSCVTARARS
jgi:hypothetical protein